LKLSTNSFARSVHSIFFSTCFFILFVSLQGSEAQTDQGVSAFKLGERFFSDSLHNLALEQYQKFLNLKPSPEKEPYVYYRIALCYYHMNKMEQAAEAFEEYIKRFPSSDNVMSAMFYAGQTNKGLKQYKEASEWFYLVWSRFVGSALAQRALFESARSASLDDNPDRAIELYETYYKRFPNSDNSKEVVLDLARLYYQKQDYSLAGEILNKGTKNFSSDDQFSIRVQYYQALIAVRMQNMQKAIGHFQILLAEPDIAFPEREEAYRQYLAFCEKNEQHKRMLTIFAQLEKYLAKRDRKLSPAQVFQWAESARLSKEYAEAEEKYDYLMRVYPDSSKTALLQYRKAECMLGSGDFSRAIETLQYVASSDSSGAFGAKAVLKMGDLYFQRELYLGAIQAYKRFLTLEIDQFQDAVLYRMGTIYQKKFNRYETALREYENLLKRFPSSPYYSKALFAMGECYEKLDDYSAALRQYRYLAESRGDGDIGDRAQDRVTYLTNYHVIAPEQALFRITTLLLPDAPGTERLMSIAEILEKDLKNNEKAFDIYKQVFEDSAKNAAKTRVPALFGMARTSKKLSEKARFEKSTQAADYYRTKAVQYYSQLIETFPQSSLASDASYGLLQVTEPNIAAYELFLAKYPKSTFAPEVLLHIAEHYEKRIQTVDRNFREKAISAYEQIRTEYPSSRHAARSIIGLARNFLLPASLDSASRYLNQFFTEFTGSPLKPEALYLQGKVYTYQEKLEDAATTLKNLLYQYPYSTFTDDARFELAEVQLRMGHIFDAQNNFEIYLNHAPEGEQSDRSRYGLGKCLVKTGKTEQARTLFESLLSRPLPDQLRARVQYEMARIAEQEGNVFKALKFYREVSKEQSYPEKGKLFSHMGSLLFSNRIYGEAAVAYESALALVSGADSMSALKGNITALIMNGKGKEADRKISFFKEQYGTQNEALAEIVYYEGIHQLAKKEYDKAQKRFSYILAKYGGTPFADDAGYQRGLSVYYAGEKDEAQKLFTDFVSQYPQSELVPLALFKIGMIHHEYNDFARAASFFEAAADHKAVDSQTRYRALNNAASDFQRVSGWNDAARVYQIILRDYPDKSNASVMNLKIGFCLIQGSKFKGSLSYIEKANINPAQEDKPEILYWLGIVHSKLGDFQKAITEFLKVPYLYSGVGKWGITAEFEAARIYERLEEYERARTLYKKIVRSDGENGEFGKSAARQLERLNNLIRE